MSVCQRHHLVEQVDIDPFDCRSTSIPSTASSVRMCVADRLRSKITRSISRQPGSESHAASGGLRLAMTTTESAGTAGKNSSRSRSSADPSRSAESRMIKEGEAPRAPQSWRVSRSQRYGSPPD